jgi:hypothetical protein
MDELNELLRPSWGAETWILEGWNKITQDEKELIKARLHDLFKDGLPFELNHDRLVYIYMFSLLAQLEVLAIQVPLRFEDKMSTPLFKQQMRAQLLDEIFHGIVFTKIVYALCAPYNSPPAYNEHIELLCDFIRKEDCPKVGVVLLNLVAEGWIEETFKCLAKNNIAPKVFKIILEDENRHVREADLYRDIGIPAPAILKEKLATLEDLFLTSLSMQPKYTMALTALIGTPETESFIKQLHEKHTHQLKKINSVPSRQWILIMQITQDALARMEPGDENHRENFEVEMSPLRKTFMTQWNPPGDPTMVGQFSIDVTCLDIFGKKFPPLTLTTLMLQAVSHFLTIEDSHRNYLSHKKLYQSRSAYVAIVVKLPNCGEHVGNIVYKNCHQLTLRQLAIKTSLSLQLMAYCYNKREQIEQKHPHLRQNLDRLLYGWAHDIYPYPVPGNAIVSVSNIGFCGHEQVVSPLRKQESFKVTLLSVEKKPVWNHDTNEFEPKDLLPVSISGDHRVFNGSIPLGPLISSSFQTMFEEMLKNPIAPINKTRQNVRFEKLVEKMLAENLDLGHRVLSMLQNMWFDFVDVEEIFNGMVKKMATNRLAEWTS